MMPILRRAALLRAERFAAQAVQNIRDARALERKGAAAAARTRRNAFMVNRDEAAHWLERSGEAGLAETCRRVK